MYIFIFENTRDTVNFSAKWLEELKAEEGFYFSLKLFCNFIYSAMSIAFIVKKIFSIKSIGTSLMVLWLRLHGPNTGGAGSIPSQEIRSYMLQLRSSTAK